jgi:hypothetical protein
MEKIIERLNHLSGVPSDISEHLPTLSSYAKECEHITELGVRAVVSTWALASGNPKVLRSYDIQHPIHFSGQGSFEDFLVAVSETGIDFSFTQADDLQIEIEETDLLFIDTWHVYDQLKKELELHGNKAKKYIIFHDTVTFGEHGEGGGVGLMPAINEFLESNPHWVVKEHFLNCNGLMVLFRKG